MEIPGLFSDYLSLMIGKPRKRLNNLKTSLTIPCLGLNSIIDSINLSEHWQDYLVTRVRLFKVLLA